MTACASRPPAPDPTAEGCVPDLGADDFPEVSTDLDGIDLDGPREIRTGDRVSYGLRLEIGDEVEDRTLTLQALSTPASPARTWFTLTVNENEMPVRSRTSPVILTIRQDEKPGRVSMLSLPSEMFATGVAAACRISTEVEDIEKYEPTETDQRNLGTGIAVLLVVLQAVQDNEELNALLMRMASWSDALSVAFSGGKMTISGAFHRAIESSGIGSLDVPAWCFPVTIKAGSRPLIHIQVLVAEPTSPLTLTGGLLAFHATHAGDPTKKLTLVLLGGKSGPR